jgi:PEP-CTERM motif
MRIRIALTSLLVLFALAVTALPAMADINFYNNGAPDFETMGWGISVPFAVTDSFDSSRCPGCTVTDLSIGVWLASPVDGIDLRATIGLGTSPFATDLGLNVQSIGNFDNQGTNRFGYTVGVETFVGLTSAPLPLSSNLWVTVEDAITSSGDAVAWDQNGGPSQAHLNVDGTIPSEAFTLSGTPQSTTPEPSSIMLFGSGILGLAGVLRRRTMR